jgi:arabinogalactan endo-1,4-beta-galactosidase
MIGETRITGPVIGSSTLPGEAGTPNPRQPIHNTAALGPKAIIHFLAIFMLSAACAAGGEFMAGADVSHQAFFENRGIVYREDGQARDALVLLKERGLNCARLRLFTSSAQQALADPYNSINNLEYTLPLAVRAKQAGLQLLLDFHYSDSWADPGKQTKPAAWTNFTFAQLEQRMYDYNSNTIAAFEAAGAMPEYVQVGNEIIQGLLWPDGKVGGSSDTPAQWQKLGLLLKAAIRGIKDASANTPPKIMIHIDRGGDWPGTRWFFDNLRQQQVEFDLIGQSYYPFWHGTLDALRNCLTNATARFGKPIIVVETAFPWSNSADIQGIPATPEGQVQFVIELARIVKSLPDGMGVGAVWWGTEYQRLSGIGLAGFDRRSFFDATGNVLPVASALGQLAAPIQIVPSLTGAALTLRWPFSGAGLSLAMATNLSPAAAWAPVTDAVQSTGLIFSVTLPGSASHSRFYRLQSAVP